LFALDAFGPDQTGTEAITAFLWHLIPVGVLAAVVAVAWKLPLVGGVVFLVGGAVYAWMARGHFTWIVLLAAPMWVVGALFLLSWRREEAVR
jgi:hypothetical protein